MNKLNYLFIALISTSLIGTGCGRKNEGFPERPVEGQRYVDSHGNSSIWNAALGYWMVSSMVGGRTVEHRYYPSTNSYTNSAGSPIARPSYAGTKSYTPSSKSTTSTSTSSSTSTTKSSGFGSTGRSSSSSSSAS